MTLPLEAEANPIQVRVAGSCHPLYKLVPVGDQLRSPYDGGCAVSEWPTLSAMRLGVYTDFPYRRDTEELFGEQAFALFVCALENRCEALVLIGREEPNAPWHGFPIPAGVGFEPLPFYSSLTNPLAVLGSLARTAGRFWRLLDDLDAVWLMGPHPVAILFAVLALARRRSVVLGVRQDLPAYVARRHPGKRVLRMLAWVLELGFRALGAVCPVVVVGPDLERGYRRFREPLTIAVSLIDDSDISSPEEAAAKSYDDDLLAVSVGRLDPEKNPLLLAEVLATLRARGEPWRLEVCGEGSMRPELERRLEELGVAEYASLRGNVPFGTDLWDVYRRGHAFLHVSWTEGFPQVLLEAFAAGLPIVATRVGGVDSIAGEAARLIGPGDAVSAAWELSRLAKEPGLRKQLIEAGLSRARTMTLSHEVARVADFIGSQRRAAVP